MKAAPHAQQELLGGVKRILPDDAKQSPMRAMGINVTTVSANKDGSGISVGVENTDVDKASVQAQLERVAGVPVTDVSTGKKIYETATRFTDTPNYFGGDGFFV